jgi:outer membrane receptor protein involved in Fe transport
MLTLTATQWIARRFNVTFDLFTASDYSLSPFGADGRQMIFDGPVKADLVTRYDVGLGNDKTAEIYLKVDNLFNQRYYEDGYLGPGAWATAGFRIHY